MLNSSAKVTNDAPNGAIFENRIVDLVSSGQTLRANNLVETDVIAWSTARLIVNRASLKMKHAVMSRMIRQLRKSRPPDTTPKEFQ